MCAVGYDGDGVKICKMKPGWESVLKPSATTSTDTKSPTGAVVGAALTAVITPEGIQVKVDNQQQRDLRAKLEEERVKAQFAERERERSTRIHELQTKILEYEEMRRHRSVASDNRIVHGLESRVNRLMLTNQEIAEQRAEQLTLLQDLKAQQSKHEKELQDLVQEKADLILERAKSEARRLAELAGTLAGVTPGKVAAARAQLNRAASQKYTDLMGSSFIDSASRASGGSDSGLMHRASNPATGNHIGPWFEFRDVTGVEYWLNILSSRVQIARPSQIQRSNDTSSVPTVDWLEMVDHDSNRATGQFAGPLAEFLTRSNATYWFNCVSNAPQLERPTQTQLDQLLAQAQYRDQPFRFVSVSAPLPVHQVVNEPVDAADGSDSLPPVAFDTGADETASASED